MSYQANPGGAAMGPRGSTVTKRPSGSRYGRSPPRSRSSAPNPCTSRRRRSASDPRTTFVTNAIASSRSTVVTSHGRRLQPTVPRRFFPSLAQLRQLRHRWHRVLVLSALTGLVTGVLVAGFEWITSQVLLFHVEQLPHPILAIAPAVGLILTYAALRWLGPNATPSTSDEYLHVYHDRHLRMNLREFPAKVLGSMATLGSGGAMGFEGPSIYMGASVGSWLQRRFSRYFSRDDAKLLL